MHVQASFSALEYGASRLCPPTGEVSTQSMVLSAPATGDIFLTISVSFAWLSPRENRTSSTVSCPLSASPKDALKAESSDFSVSQRKDCDSCFRLTGISVSSSSEFNKLRMGVLRGVEPSL